MSSGTLKETYRYLVLQNQVMTDAIVQAHQQLFGDEEQTPELLDDEDYVSQAVKRQSRLWLKHAKATHVSVKLLGVAEKQCVQLVIEDNGVGCDLAEARRAGGFGLRGIEERVNLLSGRLEMRSRPGAGTTVIVEVPVSEL